MNYFSGEKMSEKRLKIGLNGFGRIGRCVTRILASRDDIDLGKWNRPDQTTRFLLGPCSSLCRIDYAAIGDSFVKWR